MYFYALVLYILRIFSQTREAANNQILFMKDKIRFLYLYNFITVSCISKDGT